MLGRPGKKMPYLRNAHGQHAEDAIRSISDDVDARRLLNIQLLRAGLRRAETQSQETCKAYS